MAAKYSRFSNTMVLNTSPYVRPVSQLWFRKPSYHGTMLLIFVSRLISVALQIFQLCLLLWPHHTANRHFLEWLYSYYFILAKFLHLRFPELAFSFVGWPISNASWALPIPFTLILHFHYLLISLTETHTVIRFRFGNNPQLRSPTL